MSDLTAQEYDMGFVVDEGSDSHADWIPNFCVRPKADNADGSDSALQLYPAHLVHSQQHIDALEQKNHALQVAFDVLAEFTQFVLNEKIREHHNIVELVNTFASFGTPNMDTVMDLKTKYEISKLSELLHRTAAAEQEGTEAVKSICALQIKFDNLNI
jgi:hypothetical protein